jgi:hypothetical protein
MSILTMHTSHNGFSELLLAAVFCVADPTSVLPARRTSEAADAATTSSSSSSDGASGVQVTCLPLGAYSRVTITGDTITAEAGVLLDSQQQQDDSASSGAAAAGAAAQRYVCLRQYQGSQLELLTLGVEQREV